MKKTIVYIAYALIWGIVLVVLINLYVLSFSKNNLFTDVWSIENIDVWLVLGAKVNANGTPSDILTDRLTVWANAYNQWKINKIIVSGDNSTREYDEVSVMADYLVSVWVKRDDIYLDYAWFDTYDSIYRARDIFWVASVVIFTQEFHLKRAIYIWNRLWLDVVWVSTNLRKYIYADYYNRREVLARLKALEVLMSRPRFLWDRVDMSQPQEELSDISNSKN